jgi:hypothetical protein
MMQRKQQFISKINSEQIPLLTQIKKQAGKIRDSGELHVKIDGN